MLDDKKQRPLLSGLFYWVLSRLFEFQWIAWDVSSGFLLGTMKQLNNLINAQCMADAVFCYP